MAFGEPVEMEIRQKPASSYSLVSRSLTARLQSAAEKKMGDPELRAKVFQEMQQRFAALREDATFHNFGSGEKTVPGMDAAADRDRLVASLEREARFRQRSAQRDAVQTAMDALPPGVSSPHPRGDGPPRP